MDKTLIWLSIPGSLVIFAFLWVSAQYRKKSYDLEQYLLAGRDVAQGRFIVATTTVSFLGLMSLPHLGLFYRSGFSYGFIALAAIIVSLTSAMFARRTWILGRIFNALTPAQLLGDYYRSDRVRRLTAIIALLFALCVTIMSLRIALSLVEGFLGIDTSTTNASGSFLDTSSILALLTMGLMSALLYYHASHGGMGAILRIAAPVGIALVIALVIAALVSIDALGGFSAFFDQLAHLQSNPGTAPLVAQGALIDPLPAAAPSNMAWPGMMVATCLIAVIGLASTPAALMTSFTAANAKSHAPAQFFVAAFLTGLVFLTTTIMIAVATRLAFENTGSTIHAFGGTAGVLKAGSEPKLIMQILLTTPLGTPLLGGLITLALLSGLVVSAAASLICAGGMIANDVFHNKLKITAQSNTRKALTQTIIGLILIISFALSLFKPEDPLPLFLLAGAFGLQLMPALIGLCYFKKLTGQAVHDGATAGLVAVIATSSIPQGVADYAGISLPFGAWPFSLHPAFWGILTNIVVLNLTLLIQRATQARPAQQAALAHQRTYHVLPDERPLMPRHSNSWRLVALFLVALLVLATALPLLGKAITGSSHPGFFPDFLPPLWSWQFLSWFIGLALVYVLAYKLQPDFDPEQEMQGSLDPQRRRFRIKAQSRKIEDHRARPQPNQSNN